MVAAHFYRFFLIDAIRTVWRKLVLVFDYLSSV